MSGKAVHDLDPGQKGMTSSLSTATLVIDIDQQEDLPEPLYEQLTNTGRTQQKVFKVIFHTNGNQFKSLLSAGQPCGPSL